MIIYRENQPPLLSDYGIQVPMLKGRAEKVRQELLSKFGEAVFTAENSPELNDEDFVRAHTAGFLKRCKVRPIEVIEEALELINKDGGYNRYDPVNAIKGLDELVALYRESCRHTYLCLQEAHKKGFAYYLGGGFHHALSGQGRGFCLFNDIMVAAKKFQSDTGGGDVWIIDIDAHKGCGTAEISQNDLSIHTLSIHMKKGWPLDSEKYDDKGNILPWFIPSTVDVEIDSGEEDTYLDQLKYGLLRLEKKAGPVPALCIVVDGSDPYELDALPSAGHLKLSKEQCLERNLRVYNFLKDRKIPQAYLMSGGYGENSWLIHYQFIEKVLISSF